MAKYKNIIYIKNDYENVTKKIYAKERKLLYLQCTYSTLINIHNKLIVLKMGSNNKFYAVVYIL